MSEQSVTDDADEWTNWSGSVSFDPDEIATPRREAEVRDLVTQCAVDQRTVRVVASGHSATGILETDDVLVTLGRMTGLVSHDGRARTRRRTENRRFEGGFADSEGIFSRIQNLRVWLSSLRRNASSLC
ncbi:MAG: FAD-binding protein [Halorientalis sp.]